MTEPEEYADPQVLMAKAQQEIAEALKKIAHLYAQSLGRPD